MKILITAVASFTGFYLAQKLLRGKKKIVIGLDNLKK